MKKWNTIGMLAAVIILTAATTFNITYVVIWEQFNTRLVNFNRREGDYRKLDEIRAYLDAYYIGEYEDERLIEGAASGMLEVLPDGWSYYMSEDEYLASQDENLETMVGIGINAYYDEASELLRVVDVYDDSPAGAGGICFYDLILAVDATPVGELGKEKIDQALRGEVGSTVALTVQHSDGTVETLEITRAESTQQELVFSLLEGKTGYIRIPAFSHRVDVQFEGAMEELLEQGAEQFVFDLRFNPGGRQDMLCNMLDMLLPEGIIMQWEDKDGKAETISSDADCISCPMAVLVNGYSFSAAEFFAAAMQEYGAAVIVGEQTGGKCYAQSIYQLSDGSAIALSTVEYTTPQGKNLQGTGVSPDVPVQLSEELLKNFTSLQPAQDEQLQAALEALKSEN